MRKPIQSPAKPTKGSRRRPPITALPQRHDTPSAQTAAELYSSLGEPSKYRVFVSYSHDDPDKYEAVKARLEARNLCVLSDRNIGAGAPFTEAIKGLITHAHLFIALISKNAQKRPWVHQETGFAMARNVPILPIVFEDARMPKDMIAQLQAVKVAADLSDLEAQLNSIPIESLVFPRPAPPAEMVQIAEWPEQRTQWLAECANRVRDLGYPGLFRQRGAFSSFCIPSEDITHPAWNQREGNQRHNEYYRHLQREERLALEWHARRSGCRLIVDLTLRFKTRGLDPTIARLETLLSFLESTRDCRVEVVATTKAREGNLTILGDWFVADSMVPKPGGYRQTVFNWHAPTVSKWVKRFDDQFGGLCREQKITPTRSREVVIAQIRRIIKAYGAELQAKRKETAPPPGRTRLR